MGITETVLNEVDDLLMDIEILIDSDYGKVDVATFKKAYSNISDEYIKKFTKLLTTIQRNGNLQNTGK